MKMRIASVLVLAFGLGAAMAAVQPREQLWADPACSGCIPINKAFGHKACLGVSAVSAESCSFSGANDPCVLTGTGSWTPDATTCVASGPQSGVIGPFQQSNSALFFFDAGVVTNNMVAYANVHSCAARDLFGWRMDVGHTAKSFAPCVCGGAQSAAIVGLTIWQCGP